MNCGKMHAVTTILLVLSSILSTSVAHAQWRHGGTLEIINTEAFTIRISIRKNIHCYANDPIVSVPILPGESYETTLYHTGDWRGCDNVYANFTVLFDPAVGEKNMRNFWFYPNKSGAIGSTPTENDYPGVLEIDGRAIRFYTDAPKPPIPTVLEINATVIFSHIDGDQEGGSSSSVSLTEEDNLQIEKEVSFKLDTEGEYKGLVGSARVKAQLELQKKVSSERMREKEQINSETASFENKMGRFKIGSYIANVVMDHEGNIFYSNASGRSFMTFDKKNDQEQYKKFDGAYSEIAVIKWLPGLTMENLKDDKGKPINTKVQRVVADK